VPREAAGLARVIVCAHARLEAVHVLVQQVERRRAPRAGGLGDTPGVWAGATTEHPPRVEPHLKIEKTQTTPLSLNLSK